MIELYILETCPYCKKVLDFAKENDIDFIKNDVANSENHRRLLEYGGKDQVPFMRDDDVNMYESDDIIKYLNNKKEES